MQQTSSELELNNDIWKTGTHIRSIRVYILTPCLVKHGRCTNIQELYHVGHCLHLHFIPFYCYNHTSAVGTLNSPILQGRAQRYELYYPKTHLEQGLRAAGLRDKEAESSSSWPLSRALAQGVWQSLEPGTGHLAVASGVGGSRNLCFGVTPLLPLPPPVLILVFN